MVVDATVPSLALLVLVLVAVVVARVGSHVLPHIRRAVRATQDRPVVVAERWCPRVVLIDDDRWLPAVA